jgi:hypothetical protein
MDKKSKVLLWVIIVLLIASASFTYYKTIALRDYEVFETFEEESEEELTEEESALEEGEESVTLEEEI